eukprot:scaffold14.g1185.t1
MARARCPQMPAQCSITRLALLVTLVACVAMVSLTFDASRIEGLLMWVRENKGQGSVLFTGLYTVGVVLMLPAMVMAMAAGAIFGLVAGTALAWVGSSLGQTIAFVAGRYLLREMVLTYLTRQFPNWSAIDRAMETEGWKLVTLLRLSPIAPWNILNWACRRAGGVKGGDGCRRGLSSGVGRGSTSRLLGADARVTSVPLLDYAVSSAFSILPYLILFVYFGSVARNMADIFSGKAGLLDARATVGMAVGGGASIVGVVWYTTHISRKAIAKALSAQGLAEEIVHDEEIADLLRVTSQDLTAGAEAGGGGRAQRSAPASHAPSPRGTGDGGVELTPRGGGGGGGGLGGWGGDGGGGGWDEREPLQQADGAAGYLGSAGKPRRGGRQQQHDWLAPTSEVQVVPLMPRLVTGSGGAGLPSSL